jgi:hypothetical protein
MKIESRARDNAIRLVLAINYQSDGNSPSDKQ